MRKGIWYAVGAYSVWGLFPIYWKWLEQVPAPQLLAHRIGWSFVLLAFILTITRQWAAFRSIAFDWRTVRIYLSSAILIAINWFVYVWSVNSGYVVESSLGYFINPILSVLLGVLILRERLRPLQWIPIGLAGAGVIFVTIAYGSLPWIALILAVSFGLYGLVKKTAPLNALYGLTLETGILFLPALGYLTFAEFSGNGAFLHVDPVANFLLIGAGIVTTVPLLFFSSATQRIPLTLVGILQYITPTLQFLLGVFVYKEPFTSGQFLGFGLVWFALFVFSTEGILSSRRQPAPAIAD